MSPYGTFDQNGNAWEWNETVTSSLRGLRGGSWLSGSNGDSLRADFRDNVRPQFENFNSGIRIATIPEPTTATLAALLGVLSAGCQRKMAGEA